MRPSIEFSPGKSEINPRFPSNGLAGRIDAAVLDPPLSRRLTSKGFSLLVDLAKTNASFPGLGVGVTRRYLDQQAATLERVVTALTEG